jgi:hypothetical protein
MDAALAGAPVESFPPPAGIGKPKHVAPSPSATPTATPTSPGPTPPLTPPPTLPATPSSTPAPTPTGGSPAPTLSKFATPAAH